jgi:branched-chain amino acid transport system ATP-binding protein
MSSVPLLDVESIDVRLNSAQILHGASLRLESGVVGIVGRNGMGKTTLVKAIMGLVRISKGRIRFRGKDITNCKPYYIANHYIGYVPQGRNIFPSLSVDEHLRMVARDGAYNHWTPHEVYELFPRLRERSKHGGALLSGGEQQMLAIGRALVTNPELLIMDEPSEGLAPVILDALVEAIHRLIQTGMGILLVEQNLRFATEIVSGDLFVMVSGQIVQKVSGRELMQDRFLREKLLGVSTKG